jgi:CRP-like cAMP-binding protein
LAKNARSSAWKSPKTLHSNSEIHNEILLGLSPVEQELLFHKLELVRLTTYRVLHEPGDKIKSAYFYNVGLISILSVFPDGKSVEVGLVGKESFVGVPLVASFRTTPTRAIAQIQGASFRVHAEVLLALLPDCRRLERQLYRFSQIIGMQGTQIAACNRLHEVDERLARWLLMSADRIGSNSVPLTQEFLAQTLGTRRSSVTVAAGILQKAGLITHTRGDVQIIDRPNLEEAACECYGNMRQQVESWQKDPAELLYASVHSEVRSVPIDCQHVHQTFGPKGNPTARNLFEIFAYLQQAEGVRFEVRSARGATRPKRRRASRRGRRIPSAISSR